MPRKGQPLSEEQKAKMKAGREAKKAKSPTPPVDIPERAKLEPQPSMPAQEDDIAVLRRRIEELERSKFPFLQTPQVTDRGVIGTFEKYSVDPKNYPDPRPKLWEYMNSTSALRRHGFTEDNYEMTWRITTTAYETKDGRNVKEPKFLLEVWGIIYDDETNVPVKKYRIHRLVFHEDPASAIIIAGEKGLVVDETLSKDFLDEMRFLRVRDWLMDLFIPPRLNEKRESRREEVIGNRLVDVIEIASLQPSSIPFGDIKNKL